MNAAEQPTGAPPPFDRAAEIMSAVDCGTFWWLPNERIIHLDAVAAAAYGFDVPYTGDPRVLLARINREDFPTLRRAGDEIAPGVGLGQYGFELRVRQPGGGERIIEVRGRFTQDADGAPIAVGVQTDITGVPDWRRLASGQVDALPDGFTVLDQNWRVVYANETAARMAGVKRSELIGRPAEQFLTAFDPQDWQPHFEEAMRTGGPVTFEIFFPTPARWYEVWVSSGAGHLAVDVRDIHDRKLRADRDLALAQRKEKSDAFAAALGGTLGVDDVIEVFEQQLPELSGADGVAMHVVADGRLRLIAGVGYTQAGLNQLRVLDLEDPSPMSDAVRERRMQVYASGDDITARYPYLVETVVDTTTGALLVIPLEYQDACLGLVCIRYDEPREFSDVYVAFLNRTCDRLVQALYRAHRYDDELSLASRLRDELFEARLSEAPGLELAGEYRSAGLGLSVGGDWFDAIQLSRGRVGLVVGDVEGHDAHAVGGMSTVRTAVRAFAYEGYGPAAIMGRVNRLVTALDPDLLATCCYAELDLAAGTGRIARAGHPAPVLAAPDGTIALLAVPAGLPLGVDPAETYRAVLTPIPPGTLLALYSDGLVESRSMSIDVGTERLLAALRRHSGTPIAEVARRVVEGHFDRTVLGDDVTLLLARAAPAGGADGEGEGGSEGA